MWILNLDGDHCQHMSVHVIGQCAANMLQVVWPYSSGEVIVQNYNAVLSLAHLYQSADVVFAVENDTIHSICTRLLAIPKVSFSNINQVIARQLALSLAPACADNSHMLIHSHIGEADQLFCISEITNYLSAGNSYYPFSALTEWIITIILVVKVLYHGFPAIFHMAGSISAMWNMWHGSKPHRSFVSSLWTQPTWVVSS